MNTLTLVNNCHNILGAIDIETKTKIYQYLYKAPSQKLWEELYCKLVNPRSMTTIWQLVIRVNPSLNSSRTGLSWSRIPTSEELHLALFENWADLNF